jgi:hypothetical protein
MSAPQPPHPPPTIHSACNDDHHPGFQRRRRPPEEDGEDGRHQQQQHRFDQQQQAHLQHIHQQQLHQQHLHQQQIHQQQLLLLQQQQYALGYNPMPLDGRYSGAFVGTRLNNPVPAAPGESSGSGNSSGAEKTIDAEGNSSGGSKAKTPEDWFNTFNRDVRGNQSYDSTSFRASALCMGWRRSDCFR